MSDSRRYRLQRQLAELHLREHAVLVGSATTGLALLVEALGLQQREVALPDSVGLGVPLGLRLGGALPEYLDNQWRDLGLDAEALSRPNPARGAILAVHGYGQMSEMDPLITAARRQGLPLIEDASLAFGGSHHGRPAGSFGLASVVGFGSGDPLEFCQGGAVLTDDAALAAELLALSEALPVPSEAVRTRLDGLVLAHARLYGRCWPDEIATQAPAFVEELLAARDLCLQDHDPAREPWLAAMLPHVPERLQQRRDRFLQLQGLLEPLAGDDLQLLPLGAGAAPGRLHVLMPHRDDALAALREQGLHASSWHPRASQFLPGRGGSDDHPVADRLGHEILNLWVDEHATTAYLLGVQRTLADHLRAVQDLPLNA